MAYNDVGGYDKVRDTINKWTVQPVNKNRVDPVALYYSNSGYAVEQFQWNTYHLLMDMTENDEIKGIFSELALWEEYHQSLMGSLIDPDTTLQERSLALEITAVLGFSDAAQLEIEETAKVAYDYMLMDHLTHTKAVVDMAASAGLNPADIIRGQFDIQEGRPLEKQIVTSADLLKQRLDKNTADVMSFVHLHTLLANEQQLRNSFQMIRTMLPSTESRQLYNMISVVENFHITMLDSLNDPTITPLEYAMVNELMEIRNHSLGIQTAKTETARAAHDASLKGDQYHLSLLQDVYARIEQGDSSRFAVTDALFTLPEVSADAYIDRVMQTQLNLSPRGTGFEMAA